jgi:uncharacterized delta-60 repeat protein
VTISDPFLELVPELVSFRRGRIVVGARAYVPDGDYLPGLTDRPGTASGPGFSFFRLLPDGELDRRFGTRGRVDAGLPGAQVGALLPAGGFAAGRARGVPPHIRGKLEVVRLTRSGARDRAFGRNGVTRLLVEGLRNVLALEAQPGGGLLVAFSAMPAQPAASGRGVTVLRLDRSGRPDPAFGSAGRVLVPSDERVEDADLAVRPDGRLVLAVFNRSGSRPGSYGMTLAAFHANGAPDPGFGPDGSGVVTEPRGRARPRAMALGPGGRLGVAGNSAFAGPDLAAWAYAADGSRAAAGVVESARAIENGAAIDFDRAGRMLLTGFTGRFRRPTGFAVARLDGAARPDRRFGRRGLVVRRFPGAAEARAISVQPNGRLLVAGSQISLRRGPGTPRRSRPGVIRLLRLWGGPST